MSEYERMVDRYDKAEFRGLLWMGTIILASIPVGFFGGMLVGNTINWGAAVIFSLLTVVGAPFIGMFVFGKILDKV